MSPLEVFRGAGDQEIPEEERRMAGDKTTRESSLERYVERIRARTIIFFAVRVKAWKAWP